MSINPDLISTTWWFAAEAHGDQKVPGSDLPYLTHIGNVMQEVMAACENSYVEQPDLALQCAILHDTIEDTEASFEEVERHFGSSVAKGVSALSKNESLPGKRAQMEDSLARIVVEGPEVACVKVADRISNLYQPPYYWTANKKRAYAEEAQLIRDSLAGADPLLLARLDQKIADYARFYAA